MKTNLVLLAGRGKRFSDAGYKLPKPLIEVDGEPMVIASARHLPPADKLVFVVSGTYVENHDILNLLKKYFPESEIVIQTSPLQGQAHSALEAEKVINPKSELTISSCDAGLIYDVKKWEEAMKDQSTDALIWSFRNYPPMETNPTAYGWIKLNEQGLVEKVQYKVPLSDKPLNDHAVCAWFSYKTAKLCFDNVKDMIATNAKSGPEFSLDECTNVLVKNGLKVKPFEIEVFKSWGTPNELRTYEYWQRYFKEMQN
ncbi:MAG: NTP transferase domain-containing protein [Candidatus Doudnabacteria bacterium]|nr:NTP transferase domain-containing protein [Candidatus Doudnabacteria bacterium]